MTEEIKRQLWEWAAAYHCAGFIQNDPVQFPHRYERKQDIEISGLLTAIMSFGNRKQILKKADELHRLMGVSPHQYVLSCRWKNDFPATDRSSFYRMLSYADFHSYFRRLHAAYSAFDSLEDALCTYAGNPMERLCAFLEVSAKSPQKKLNMFLRWMIRKGPEVDFGIWERFDCRYNPQIQISAESETKRSIFREKDKTKRSKKESAQHSKSRNKSFVMTSVSAL